MSGRSRSGSSFTDWVLIKREAVRSIRTLLILVQEEMADRSPALSWWIKDIRWLLSPEFTPLTRSPLTEWRSVSLDFGGNIIYRSLEGGSAARTRCQETSHLWLTTQWHSELVTRPDSWSQDGQRDGNRGDRQVRNVEQQTWRTEVKKQSTDRLLLRMRSQI